MNDKKKNTKVNSVIFALFLSAVFITLPLLVNSAEKTYSSSPVNYECDDTVEYSLSEPYMVEDFSYEKKSAGAVSIKGDINKQTTYNGVEAYGVNDNITLGYTYSGILRDNAEDQWNICSDSCKNIGDISLKKKIGWGTVIIQKSSNGINWENACDPIYDFFKGKSQGKSDIYLTTDDEIKKGTYYRMIVAYEIKKKVGEKDNWLHSAIYSQRRCTEIYEFYVCSDKDYIVIKDFSGGNTLADNSKVDLGFYIDKSGSSAEVSTSRDGEKKVSASDGDYRTFSGEYTIYVTTKLGEHYQHNITVSKGTSITTMDPVVFDNEDSKGYTENLELTGATCFGANSLTNLQIGTKCGYETTKSEYNGMAAYGVTGDSVSLYLNLKYPESLMNDDWDVVYDKYGKKDNEDIDGIHVGEVGKGALIVCTSSDGTNWQRLDGGRYADGLYTTDFGTYYTNNESILVYTPNGDDIKNGIYIRVLYAYEVYQEKPQKYKDYLEKYEFYLCNNELGAVTFHNLTAEKILDQEFGDKDENTAAVHKKVETMLSGAMTVTGFQVDTASNQNIYYEIYRDGLKISNSKDDKYTVSGKYDIYLKSVLGDTREVTLYIDTSSTSQSLRKYFGESFIEGKRIYSDGAYPKYEGGLTCYHLESQKENYLPLSGTIRRYDSVDSFNLGNNPVDETKVKSGRAAQRVYLCEPGMYEVELTTTNEAEEYCGDYKTFTFRFELIEEGTAPGPQLNKESLKEFSQSRFCDLCPIYYGLKYHSASSGDITYAFCDYDTAREMAYKEKVGLVEIQDDGSFRYSSLDQEGQKEIHDDQYELTEAINVDADKCVVRHYFDMSDEFTYRTLKESVFEENPDINLRQLSIAKSVIVPAAGEMAKLQTKLQDADYLPIINSKPVCYMTTGSGEDALNEDYNVEVSGLQYGMFMFIKDPYGIDSNKVEITDCNGNTYPIRYNTNVDGQLKEAGCATGIITITESTIYDDTTTYEAVYFQPGDNTAQINLGFYDNGKANNVIINQSNADEVDIQADAFSIKEFTDELDPYCLMIIKCPDGHEDFYVADESIDEKWYDPGDYTLKIVNRLGYNYSFNVHVNESDYAEIIFEGDGCELIESILTRFGEKDIDLPELSRTGYIFNGYVDEEGNVYREKIDEVLFKGTLVLSADWTPEKCTIIIKDRENNELMRTVVDYDSTYNLPVPTVEDGYEFIGWTRDGENVSGEIIVNEKEIILVEQVRDVSSSVSKDETTEEPAQEATESPIEELPRTGEKPEDDDKEEFRIMLLVLCCLLCLLLLARSNRKHKQEEKKRKKEEIKKQKEEMAKNKSAKTEEKDDEKNA